MSGKAPRAKGGRGQTAAFALLESRGYLCEATTAGRSSCDIIARKDGVTWSVEAKNTVAIDCRKFRKQAMDNAKPGTRWMVLAHIDGSRSWVVLRQGERPAMWHEESGCR